MMTQTPKFDPNNPTWITLKDYLKERLQVLRERNDALISQADTDRLRGQIAEIKVLLSLEIKTGEKSPED